MPRRLNLTVREYPFLDTNYLANQSLALAGEVERCRAMAISAPSERMARVYEQRARDFSEERQKLIKQMSYVF